MRSPPPARTTRSSRESQGRGPGDLSGIELPTVVSHVPGDGDRGDAQESPRETEQGSGPRPPPGVGRDQTRSVVVQHAGERDQAVLQKLTIIAPGWPRRQTVL